MSSDGSESGADSELEPGSDSSGRLSWLRSVLFASKLHTLVTILLGVILLGVVAATVGIVGAPSVQGVDNRFGDVNATATTIESDLTVNNPNPINIQLGGTTVDYAIDMNGILMAEGTREGLTFERGNSSIPLTTHMANERIPDWWVSHVDGGERTEVTVNADAHSSALGASFGAPTVEREIETDITGGLNSTERRPVNASMPLVSDPVLYVEETSGSWGEVSDEETGIDMAFTLYNPKDYAVPVSELGYDVGMNGVDVGEGATDRSTTIPPGETRTITATTTIENDRLDEWWVSHLQRDQVTTLTIDFYANVDLSTLGAGTVQVPLDNTSQQIETDIFGNEDETAGVNDEASGPGEATPTDSGATDADGTIGDGTPAGETETPTEDDPIDDPLDTPTPSPTPDGSADDPTPTPDGGTDTPTETEDGGLL